MYTRERHVSVATVYFNKAVRKTFVSQTRGSPVLRTAVRRIIPELRSEGVPDHNLITVLHSMVQTIAMETGHDRVDLVTRLPRWSYVAELISLTVGGQPND